MPLLHRKLRAAVNLVQPNLAYVGGASGVHTGTNIPIAINALVGGLGSAAQVGDFVVAAIVGSGSDIFFVTGSWDTKQADLYPPNLCVATTRLTAPTSSLNVSYSGGLGTEIFAWAVQVWRNTDASTPIDATTTTATGAGSGDVNAPSITTVTSGAIVIAVGGTVVSGVSDLTMPTDMGYFIHQRNGNPQVAMAAANVIAPLPYDPPAFGGGTSGGSPAWAAASIAIRPA